MADDPYARIAELEAELGQARAETAALRERELLLMGEVEQRDNALVEAREQQMATAEVLRVIASSPKDVQRVLEAVTLNARRVSGSSSAGIRLREGNTSRIVTFEGDEGVGAVGDVRPLDLRVDSARAILERRTVHVPDRSAEAFAREFPDSRHHDQVTSLAVPLVHDGAEAIGALTVVRSKDRQYSQQEIALLETFAD